MIIYFAPDCVHCQHLMFELKPHMKELKNIQVVMITFVEQIKAIQVFARDFDLKKYPNWTVGTEGYTYKVQQYYHVATTPYIAIYDKSGEQHYDIISAFIKSLRGSDPNAAVYYLARMIEGGEDVKFIARRMVILASEDIGNANPNALLLAQSCFNAVNVIGMPESQLILSQTVIYLATSAKSNSATTAIGAAMSLVKQTGDLPVPLHLRNAPTRLMKDLGFGREYRYAHEEPGAYAAGERYLPDGLPDRRYYRPVARGLELKIGEALARLRAKSPSKG